MKKKKEKLLGSRLARARLTLARKRPNSNDHIGASVVWVWSGTQRFFVSSRNAQPGICVFQSSCQVVYTPNANMADLSAGECEAS